MIPYVVYLIEIGVALVIGVVVTFIFYQSFSYLRGLWVKRKFPKDKKQLGEFIRTNEKIFASPINVEISEKEVNERDKRKFGKFREYEKLRRKVGVGQRQITRDVKGSERTAEDERSRGIPDRSIKNGGIHQSGHPCSTGESEQYGRGAGNSKKQPKINRPIVK